MKQKLVYLALGDSITFGQNAARIGETDYVSLLAAFIQAKYPEKRVICINAGVPGATARDVAEMVKVLLFQYGSNLNSERLNCPNRLNGAAKYVGNARLAGYRLVFDLFSAKNQSAVADIVIDAGAIVIGALYEVEGELVVDPTGAMSRMDIVENAKPDGTGNYARHIVEVQTDPRGEKVRAYTYIGTQAARQRFLDPSVKKTISTKYLDHILNGARQKEFPAEYIKRIETIAEEHNRML